MRAQVVLTPVESKKLIAKATARMDNVRYNFVRFPLRISPGFRQLLAPNSRKHNFLNFFP